MRRLAAGTGVRLLRYLLQVIVVARTTQVVLVVPVESFETTVQLPSADGVMVENPKPLTEVVSTTVAPPMSMPAPGTVVGCEARLSPLFPIISCGARAGEKSNVRNVCVWPERIRLNSRREGVLRGSLQDRIGIQIRAHAPKRPMGQNPGLGSNHLLNFRELLLVGRDLVGVQHRIVGHG